MRLNDAGRIVAEEWSVCANAYTHVVCDAHVVMPNHFHGIFVFTDRVGAIHESPLQTPEQMSRNQRRNMGLSKLMGRFKMCSGKRINALRNTLGSAVWQRNYYEHIIRNEASLNRIRQYIFDNPVRWTFDRENPAATTPEPKDAWQI